MNSMSVMKPQITDNINNAVNESFRALQTDNDEMKRARIL